MAALTLMGSWCASLSAQDGHSFEQPSRLPPISTQIIQGPGDSPWIHSGQLSSPADAVADDAHWYDVHAVARAAFINDQRIEWSGQEDTFEVEAAIRGAVGTQYDDWETKFVAELFFNQPFDQNILADTAERRSYAANFQVDTFKLSQLWFEARNGNAKIALGKMETPFGRWYFPTLRNDFRDGPFIRTESILWRETGLLVQWDPGPWVLAAAITNGSEDRDTNSSKALISRVGLDLDTFAAGASVKWQDGVGSEGQKMYNNHVGADFMLRGGPFTLSGEVIYDQYGFRRPGIDPNNITWPRSIYFRDQNRGLLQPIQGVGYYVNLNVDLDRWFWVFNYGEFYPQSIGDPRHDETTRRGFSKAIWHITPHWDMYSMVLVENWLPNAQARRTRKGVAVLVGFQSGF